MPLPSSPPMKRATSRDTISLSMAGRSRTFPVLRNSRNCLSLMIDALNVRPRTPGFLQGILLLLPITMAVMGISVLTPVVHLLLEQFKSVQYHDYLVIGGVLTMPAIWILLFSPLAGWLADRFGRRKLLLVSMVVYAFVGMR